MSTAATAQGLIRLSVATSWKSTGECGTGWAHIDRAYAGGERRPSFGGSKSLGRVAAKFDAHFERMWDAARPMIEFAPAINALEPK